MKHIGFSRGIRNILMAVVLSASAHALAGSGKARVLTISGGISLGAYEAGYNWAFIRDLKARRTSRSSEADDDTLAGVSGASAGTINTFLTAIAWCQKPEIDKQESAENNAFWNTWTKIGWNRLFPSPGMSCEEYRQKNDPDLSCAEDGPEGSAYLRDDGVFTRRAFEAVERDIAARVAKADFMDGCQLPIGMTVTKVVPDSLQVGDSTQPGARPLQIATQRFAIALQARVDERGLGFYTNAVPEDPKVVGKYLRLPADGSRRVRVVRDANRNRFTLFDAIEASSAFPVAFGPKSLLFCSAEASLPASAECPPGMKSFRENFVDGGVFDNIPLGLATTFVTTPFQEGQPRTIQLTLAGLQNNDYRVRFHYIDPDTLRGGDNSSQTPVTSSGHGLGFLGRLVGNFITVGRQYELQTVSRFGWTENADFQLSTRYAAIVGEQLGAFGAFTAKPFRKYDYFVGVYDALHDFAEETCVGVSLANRRFCEMREVYGAHKRLGLENTKSTSFVVRQLLRRELEAQEGVPGAAGLLSRPTGEGKTFAQWIDEIPEAQVAPWLVKLVRVGAQGAVVVNANKSLLKRFTYMVGALGSDAEGLGEELDSAEHYVIEDTEGWFWLAMAQVLDRMRAIEQESKSEETDGALAFSLGEEVARTEWVSRRTGLSWAPGTGVGGWGALPYNVTFFPGRGGIEAGWRPSWMPGEHFGLNAPLVPFTWWRQSHVAAAVGLNGVWRPGGAFVSMFEAGPRVFFDYWRVEPAPFDLAHRWGIGADAGLYMLGGKLRLGVLLRNFPGRTDGPGLLYGEWSPEVSLGVADVPGLARMVGRAIF